METVRENILANIKTTLETITTGSGYHFDFTSATIQRWDMNGNRFVDLPAVVIVPGDEEETDGPDPFKQCKLSVFLDAYFVNDTDDSEKTDTYLNRLQGDIKKALLLDHTRGGYAIDTNILGTTPFETVDGQHYAGITIEVEILYQHLRLDPGVSA